MEFAKDSEQRLHIIRPTSKYWTLCNRVVQIRNRWHGTLEDFRIRDPTCETCAREVLVLAS
jgi:hypothetical protein